MESLGQLNWVGFITAYFSNFIEYSNFIGILDFVNGDLHVFRSRSLLDLRFPSFASTYRLLFANKLMFGDYEFGSHYSVTFFDVTDRSHYFTMVHVSLDAKRTVHSFIFLSLQATHNGNLTHTTRALFEIRRHWGDFVTCHNLRTGRICHDSLFSPPL